MQEKINIQAKDVINVISNLYIPATCGIKLLDAEILSINIKNKIILIELKQGSFATFQIISIAKFIFNIIKDKFNIAPQIIIDSKENIDKKIFNQNIKIPLPILGVKEIIGIFSAKGGVGKSTISAHIAYLNAKLGKNIAYIDADIYGPSSSYFFNNQTKAEIINGKLEPIIIEPNLRIMSISNLTDAHNDAHMLRGPMVTKLIHNMTFGTNWNDIDLMIIDMPPGTGDINISLMENIFIDNILPITTNHPLSLLDFGKSLNMLDKFQIPINFLIRNMLHYEEQNEIPDSIQELISKHNIELIDIFYDKIWHGLGSNILDKKSILQKIIKC